MKKILLLLCLAIPSVVHADMLITDEDVTSVSAPAVVDITTNLTYYWMLDEGAGTVARSTAGVNNGTLTNTPTWIVGKSSGAVHFVSASSQYIAMQKMAIANINAWSVSLWLRDNAGTHDNAAYGEGNTGTGNPLIIIGNNQNGTGDICGEVRDDAAVDSQICHSNSYNDNVWHHVVLNHASKSSMELFIDGVSRGTETTARGAITNNNARIGSLGRLSGGFSDCDVDQVRVYTAVLSATQITYLKDNGL